MSDKYILEGHKAVECDDLMVWAKWFETADRTVARTNIGIPYWKFWLGKLLRKKWEPITISTVFIGLDHQFGDEGPPLLFETMVFGGKHDEDLERYFTWQEAEEGHKRFVKKIRKGL